jgi:hypothetical protein
VAKRAKRSRSRAPRSYAWALEFDATDPGVLRPSSRAQDGLDYARRMARHAALRREEALFGEPRKPPTVADVASEEGVSRVEVNISIKQARIELFGRNLSDSGIRQRRRRERELAAREPRTFEEEGCDEALPRNATARRRYCEAHLSPAARVRRFRAK